MDPKSMSHAAQPYHDYSYDMMPLPYPTQPPPAFHSPASRLHPSHLTTGYHPSYYGQHHPLPVSPAPVIHSNHEKQAINTLFVSGLPDDIKAREIHNLFSRHHGFDSCQLKYTGHGNQVVAFATFTNHHSAMAAMGALDRTIFDPETGATLHIELARSNSRKRPRGGAPYMIIDKRTRVHEDDENNWSNDGDGGSDEPSDTENNNSRNKAAFTATQSRKPDRKPANGRTAQDSEKAADTIRPCSTLFIANLGPTCTEAELEQVLSKFSGFRTLKMKGRSGMPVAFADFEDVESAAAALESLRGTTIGSSDRGEIHIEYARSKMRKA